MRENRTYGSEGGGAGKTGPPYLYPARFATERQSQVGALDQVLLDAVRQERPETRDRGLRLVGDRDRDVE